MPSGDNKLTLTLQVDPQGYLGADERNQLTHHLIAGLKNLGAESVNLVSNQRSQARPGTKGIDPVTLGAISAVVVQAVLPKALEFLQALSLRKQGHVVKVKVQHENQSIEIEFPESIDPGKMKKHIETVESMFAKRQKRH